MTKEEFDNYRFTIKTIVKVSGNWHKISAVDFLEREILVESDNNYSYLDIQNIKEG